MRSSLTPARIRTAQFYLLLFLVGLGTTAPVAAFLTLLLDQPVKTAIAYLCVGLTAVSVVVGSMFNRIHRRTQITLRGFPPAVHVFIEEAPIEPVDPADVEKHRRLLEDLVRQNLDRRIHVDGPGGPLCRPQGAQVPDLPEPNPDRPFGIPRDDAGPPS
jgi:hypothetical protein